MIDEDGKRTSSPEEPAIPPHMLEDLTPAQKKAFGLTGKHAKDVAKDTHKPATKQAK